MQVKKPHNCKHCGKVYIRKSDMVKPYQNIVANGLHKNYTRDSSQMLRECEHCGKAFTLKSTMITQSRRHKREKPFQCGKVFMLNVTIVTLSSYGMHGDEVINCKLNVNIVAKNLQ